MIGIQDLIDQQLEPKEKRQRSGKFSPSSFGKCFRSQIWNRMDEPQTNPPDKRQMRVFKVGQIFHAFVQDLLVERGYTPEVLIETEDVKGYADLVNDEEVADLKSQHSKAFWYMSKTDDIKKDKYNNWLQVAYYAMQLGKRYMRLVFISKDDLCIQEYRLEVDKLWIQEVDKELTVLRHWWETKELPPGEPRAYVGKDGKSKECDYCNWKDKCKRSNDLFNLSASME